MNIPLGRLQRQRSSTSHNRTTGCSRRRPHKLLSSPSISCKTSLCPTASLLHSSTWFGLDNGGAIDAAVQRKTAENGSCDDRRALMASGRAQRGNYSSLIVRSEVDEVEYVGIHTAPGLSLLRRYITESLLWPARRPSSYDTGCF